jgi:hypothetical protein
MSAHQLDTASISVRLAALAGLPYVAALLRRLTAHAQPTNTQEVRSFVGEPSQIAVSADMKGA